MNKWSGWVCFVVLAFAFSCSGDRIFEEFHSFNSLSWNERDTVAFDLKDLKDLKEKGGKKLIGVRYNEEYPFSNCYVRVISKDSTGNILDNKLINVPLFDSKSGQPNGGGFGNSFTLYDTLPFEIADQTHELVFLQYMRQQDLPGLEAVGLKILK